MSSLTGFSAMTNTFVIRSIYTPLLISATLKFFYELLLLDFFYLYFGTCLFV